MAGNLQQRLDSLRSKATLLTQRYVKLVEASRESETRIASLEKELKAAQDENKRLKLQIEELRVVTTLTPRREDVERSRAILTELVREIDKCIEEFSE